MGSTIAILGMSILQLRALVASLDLLLLDLERARQVVEERVECLGHSDMEQNSEDEEDNHQNSRARSLGDNEHSDEADLGKINTDEKLLQSSGVNKTSSVDLGLCDKQDVVTVGK